MSEPTHSDHTTDPRLEAALNRHRLGDSYAAIYPQFPADFPSDEDIEVAAKAMYDADDANNRTWGDEGERNGVRDWYRDMARAALQAIADARRTEEER